MIRHIFAGTFLLLSLFITVVVQAQPAVVQRALDDINTRTGRSLTLNDLNWRYSQNIYDGNNLGCPHVQNTSGGPVSIVAYQIEFDEGFDDVWEWDYRVSEDGTLFFLCAPEGYNPIPTPATCAATTPRLTVGGQGRVLPGSPNILRDSPAQGGHYIMDVPGGASFTVIGGPRCSGGFTWWQIDYNGQVGWTVESVNRQYALEPVSAGSTTPTATSTAVPSLPTILPTIAPTLIYTPLPTAMQFTCIDLPPRLTRGGQARVTPGLPNVLRERPTADSRYLGEVPGEGVFDVLDGPQCAEGYIWWYIQYNGQQGWTIENFETEYVLEPINPSPAVITPYNAVRLQQVTQLEVNALAIFGQTYRHFWAVEGGNVPTIYELTSEQPFTWERKEFPVFNVFASLPTGDPSEPLWFVRQTSTEVAVYKRQNEVAEMLTVLDITDFGVGFTPLDVYTELGQHLLLANDVSGRLSLWDLRPDTPPTERLILSPFGVFDDAVFTGGDFGLFAAISGGEINFYDASGAQIRSIGTAMTPYALDFGVNGTEGKLVIGGISITDTPIISIWNAGPEALRQVLPILSGDTSPTPVLHPHLTVIATIGHTPWGHNLYLWDVETGTLVYEQTLPAGGQLSFSADGKMLFATLENGQILGWTTYY